MILLITGKPGAGKSTLIQKLIDTYSLPVHWVVTQEIRDAKESRVGFRAINSAGESRIISHKHDIESDTVIGQNKVDLVAVDAMFASFLHYNSHDLLCMDEIGPIQLLSKPFTQSLRQFFRKPREQFAVATIHQTDRTLARYRKNRGVILVTVTDETRDWIPGALLQLIEAHADIDALKPAQFARFRVLLASYLHNQQSTQLAKLLKNALLYSTAGRVHRAGIGTFQVAGNHDKHVVSKRRGHFTCDCDLFNGRGIYEGAAGTCSHIQAVQICYR